MKQLMNKEGNVGEKEESQVLGMPNGRLRLVALE